MASGYYPLQPRDAGYAELKEIKDKLDFLLRERGDCGNSPLPAAWDNDQYDNAATDGQYEQLLYLASEFVGRCIKEPQPAPAPNESE